MSEQAADIIITHVYLWGCWGHFAQNVVRVLLTSLNGRFDKIFKTTHNSLAVFLNYNHGAASSVLPAC